MTAVTQYVVFAIPAVPWQVLTGCGEIDLTSAPARGVPFDGVSMTDVSAPGADAFQEAQELFRRGRIEAAATLCEAVLAQRPDCADAHHLAGSIGLERRRHGEALAAFDRGLRHRPDRAALWTGRGLALRGLGRLPEALDSLDRALAIAPDSPGTLLHKADLLMAMKRHGEALGAWDVLRAARPGLAAVHRGLAEALLAMRRHDAALAAADDALRCEPGRADHLVLRARIRREMRQPEAAAADLERARVLAPDSSAVHGALGALHMRCQRFAEGRAALERAVELAPGNRRARVAAGLAQLLLGDFERGWENMEYRLQPARPVVPGDGRVPMWDGRAPLAGKTILLMAEQGLGDTLQFCRFAPHVAAMGAVVFLWVQRELNSLLRPLPGIAGVLSPGDAVGWCDYRYPLMSLPHALGVRLDTIPAAAYLAAPADRTAAWAALLPADGRPRVGLAWSGNPRHDNDHNRSMTLDALRPVLALGDRLQFVSLQKNPRPADRHALAAHPQILDRTDALEDFGDTAGLIANLDLTISVDTSVVHLAGALGRPVWVLLAATPSWRWLLERDDSPWYAAARLYRQASTGDWAGVARRVAASLASWRPDRVRTAGADPAACPRSPPPPTMEAT
ncbi:hypothetical protein STVA_39840 [Allostella vacuolata]|nr:hypothetical protein STVA_39840 [Stella vacuolata]